MQVGTEDEILSHLPNVTRPEIWRKLFMLPAYSSKVEGGKKAINIYYLSIACIIWLN